MQSSLNGRGLYPRCGRTTSIVLLLLVCLFNRGRAAQKAAFYDRQAFETDVKRIYQRGDPDAVDNITDHGDITLSWLIEKLADQRRMEADLRVRNSKEFFEEFAMYRPLTLSDAIRTMLTRITGFVAATSDAPKTIKERAKGVQQWRTWYRQHRRDLKWIPAYRTYDWKGRDEFEKKITH